MNDLLSTLRALSPILSVSGAEHEMASFLSEKMQPLCDRVWLDAMGNLLCEKKSASARGTLLISAHMDEIGFLVCDADECGFVLLAPIGGIKAEAAAFSRVKFENGKTGVLVPRDGTKKADLDAKTLVCDIGAKSRSAALRSVKIGDRCRTVAPLVSLSSRRVSCRALDNRAGVAALLHTAFTLKDEQNLPYNLIFAFTVQEEVGLRGAAPAAFAIEPDFCINVDVTHACDAPGAKGAVKLGGGVCIKYKDRSVICDRAMIRHLETCAKSEKIPTQVDILTFGGTDTGAIQSSRAGVVSGALSIPLRYMHTDAETMALSDLEGAVKLLTTAIKHEISL